eukprot:TRINITY_DN11534_c0_g1_i1.p1 TRINITY_DN11534_c0_g1~~TRINITY_DN11534_c0_g1_i1.p1  ORF type:complete len:160 (+),score=27.41 TRINITY_DN11534_c0_g1_i1:104-583(+)
MTEVSKGIIVRKLQPGDYEKGFLQLLSQLTTVGEIIKSEFEQRIIEMELKHETYNLFVLEDVQKSKVIGCATLLVELKFVHNCGKVGHIEDVVVDSTYRGLNLGKLIINHLMQVGKAAGCYKIHLDCSEKNVPFYQKCGFTRKEIQMVWYDKQQQPAKL